MSILAQDAFAGSGALSGNWTVDQGTAARSSGECALTDTGTGQVNVRYTGIGALADHYAQVKIGSVVETVTDTGAGPMCRAQDANNYYFLQGNTNETKLFSKVGGTFTQLGSNGPAIAAGDVLYISAQGTTITAKKNGANICGTPLTDSGLSTGRGAIWGGPDVSSLVLTVDDFEVGDFTASVGPGFIPGRGTTIRPLGRNTVNLFVSRQLSAGTNVTLPLIGIGGTFATGSLSPSGGDQGLGLSRGAGPGISPDYTRLFLRRRLSQQTASNPDVTVALTGIGMSFFAGILTPNNAEALTGNAGTFTTGILTPSESIALTGTAVTLVTGTLTPNNSHGLLGTGGIFSTGTMTTAGDVTVALTGIGIGASAGLMTPNITVALIGTAVSSAPGTMIPVLSLALTGNQITSATGTMVPASSIQLTGQQVLFNTGTLQASGGDPPLVTTGSFVGFICNVGTLIDRQ